MSLALGYEARKRLRRWLHPVEAVPILAAYFLLWLLPLDWASALGGCLARHIGPRLPVQRVGRANLAQAFPDWPPERITRTLAGVWENLGRTVAEYPHLARIMRERVKIESHISFDDYRRRRAAGQTAIFFSGHCANWEILPAYAAYLDYPLITIFRSANNPYVDRLVQRSRRQSGRLVPKGAGGLRDVIAAMKQGQPLGLLIDQKLNAGIAVPFFGREAMTGTVLAQLASRFDCPAVPAWVERLAGARFRLVVGPALDLPASEDSEADVRETMSRVNALLEAWIRQRPEQWLWLHRRWPKERA
jgi:Kdo2-lipid IVA lauroyltransferase/acyltransferase